MKKEIVKNIIIIFLSAVAIFTVLKYALSFKEKCDLSNSLEQAKEQAQILENQKQNLLQELGKEKESRQNLKGSLKASAVRLRKLFREAAERQDSIEQLNSRISLARAENALLKEEGGKLKGDYEALKTKLSSIAELKKALRELKIEIRRGSRKLTQKNKSVEEIIEGNRGFLIRDGKFTYPAKVKIEVVPAAAKE